VKTTLIGTALTVAIVLINPIFVTYAKPPNSYKLESAIAQVQEKANIPDVVAKGLELYKQGDVEAAVNKWADSTLALLDEVPIDFAQKQEQTRLFNQSRPIMTAMLVAVSKQYGDCKGYSIIKSIPRNQNTRTIYLEMQHEKGSIFMEFITLKTEKDWRIVHFHFSPDIEDIFR
jgi:polynucleotide 5'-kinase involved in rRNA processing